MSVYDACKVYAARFNLFLQHWRNSGICQWLAIGMGYSYILLWICRVDDHGILSFVIDKKVCIIVAGPSPYHDVQPQLKVNLWVFFKAYTWELIGYAWRVLERAITY